MKPTTFAIRGTVCFSTDSQNLTCLENAFIVCQDGRTVGVFPELPAQFEGIPVEDVGDQLIIPGMNDLHLHAPQYAFHGMYMDLELLEWLNQVTFPGGSPLCRSQLRRESLFYLCRGSAPECHDTCFHLCNPACRGNRTSDGSHGKNRSQNLYRKGQYGPQWNC